MGCEDGVMGESEDKKDVCVYVCVRLIVARFVYMCLCDFKRYEGGEK